jgi:hypothetical protein
VGWCRWHDRLNGDNIQIAARSGFLAMPDQTIDSSTAAICSILQLKIRLLGLSPMIWRRVLVPAVDFGFNVGLTDFEKSKSYGNSVPLHFRFQLRLN